MNEFATISKDRLKKMVAETEIALADLKEEIDRRETVDQEAALDDLDLHFKNAELSLQTIRNFFSYLREEYKKH